MENNENNSEELNVTSAPENVEEVVNEPIKVKKPKQLVQEEQEVSKVNIDVNPNKIPSPGDEPVKVDLTEDKEEVVEDVVEEKTEVEDTPEEKTEVEETPVVQEITDEEVQEKVEEVAEEITEAIEQSEESGKELPENIQKVVDFIDETGGSLEDYVRSVSYTHLTLPTILLV